MTTLTPRLLISDTTPLSLLSMVGAQALDWLFVPRAELWITDMVRHEALRDPDPGQDWRAAQRETLRSWLATNAHRIHIQPTPEGEDYARETRNWLRGGSVPEDRPTRRHRGERSIQDLLPAIARMIATGQALILLVDDRAARALLIQEARTLGLDTDLMGTATFLALLDEVYHVANARDVWLTIRTAAGGRQPEAPVDDPVYVRQANT